MATAAATPPLLTRYHQLFARDDHDPYEQSYRPLMAEFRCNNNPFPPATLFDAATHADLNKVQAYIGLIELGGTLYYKVYHAVAAFPRSFGVTTLWDGLAFASTGDYTGANIATVVFPTDAFDVTNGDAEQNVPGTLARAKDLLLANPNDDFLKPLADNAAQIKQVKSRMMVPLPHRYVPSLLKTPVKARDGFVLLASALEAYSDVDTCKELVDWLLLSIMQVNNTTGPSPGRPELSGVVADTKLLSHRESILHRHLPGLQGGPPTDIAADVAQMARATNRMADQQELARQARNELANKDTRKTVKQWLGESTTQTLLRYTLCEQEEQLPEVWLSLARAGKQDRAAMEAQLLATAQAMGKPEAAPYATADLIKKITKLEWAGPDPDDLTQGIHPFSILLAGGYLDPEHTDTYNGARTDGDAYDTVMSGSHIGMLDAQKLKKTKVVVPRQFGEAKAHLAALSVVWTTLLGQDHPFAEAYSAFVYEFVNNDYAYQKNLQHFPSSIPGVTLLLRAVQLKTVAYWRKARTSLHGLPTAPNFAGVLENISELNRSWVPTFPSHYISTNDNDSGGGADGTNTNNNSGGRTNRTGADGTNPNNNSGGRTNRTGGTPVRNEVSSAFEPFKEKIRNMRITDAIRIGGAIPKVTREGQGPRAMCGAYHLKGSCWTNCERAYDHGPHSAEEDAKLVSWCQRAYA